MAVWLGDFDVSRMLARVPHPYSEEDAEDFLAREPGDEQVYAIERKGDGLFLGTIGFNPAEGYEFGYWLGKPFWGLGYATEALKAAQQLADDGIPVDVFSVTSWSELARDGMEQERRAMEEGGTGLPYITGLLAGSGPVIAASDYVRAVPESVRAYVPAGRRYVTLGTDGFGRSDARKELRAFFEVDARSIAFAAVTALCEDGALPAQAAAEAASRWAIDVEAPDPWTI